MIKKVRLIYNEEKKGIEIQYYSNHYKEFVIESLIPVSRKNALMNFKTLPNSEFNIFPFLILRRLKYYQMSGYKIDFSMLELPYYQEFEWEEEEEYKMKNENKK